MLDKSLDFWIALAASTLFVYEKSNDRPLLSRLALVAISAGLGYSLAPDVAGWTGRSETLAAVVLTTLGYLVLDFMSALVADREFIKEVIKARFGKK